MLSRDCIDSFLLTRQEVEKESRESPSPEKGCDGPVSLAQPTAAAAVRENNEPMRVIRDGEVSRQLSSAGELKMNYLFMDGRAREIIHMILRRARSR
jgi:hypothetical protein